LSLFAFTFRLRDISDAELPAYSFEDYLQDFGKSYPSHLEYSIHMKLFEARKAEAIAQNSMPGSWKAGINKFTDMTDAEFKAYRGYNQGMALLSDAPRVHIPAPAGGLPTSVDWRTQGVVTAVKDQGSCGSCWAFATTEGIESAYAITAKASPIVLSPQNVVSCTQNPQHCGGTGGCGGATAELGTNYVRDNGIALESSWPYTATNGVCNEDPKVHPKVVTVSGYVKLGENNYTDLINAVATVGPIDVSVDASSWNVYRSGIFNGCNQKNPDIDHAVQLVGYGTENGQDYWIVRNSWGSSWGENGYIRLLRHSDGSSQWCGTDTHPSDGSGCDGGPTTVTVCGTCGIWYDNCYPVGAKHL